MKKIRLGNDIQFTWTVEGLSNTSGSKTVQLIDQFGHIEQIEYNINGDVVNGKFYGKDQEHSGVYRLVLVINAGLKDMATLDHVKAFSLVDVASFGIMSGTDDDTVETVTLDLHGSLRVGNEDDSHGGGGEPGGITVEVDPTVPAWAKEPTKPVYTAAEVGAMPANAQVVTDVRKQVVTTDERDITLEPNKYYIFGECATLTIAVGEPITHGLLNEYEFEFDSGDTPTVLNVAEGIYDSSLTQILPNTKYRCTVINNILTVSSAYDYHNGVDDFFKRFLNGDITRVVIPDDVTIIRRYLFYTCRSLTSVVLPESMETIDPYAFCSCAALNSINFPNALNTLATYAFQGCTSLGSADLANTQISVIGDKCFDTCTSLSYLTLPSTLRTIGQYAFSGCTRLASVVIPYGVTNLGAYTFNNCTGLTSVTVPNTCVAWGQNAFSNTRITTVNIPSGVTALYTNTFSSCSTLTNVTIPNTVTRIDATVFYNCTALTSIEIPDSVTILGANVFQGCSALKDLTIHDSIATLTQATSLSGMGAGGKLKIIGTNRVVPYAVTPATVNVYVDDTMVNTYKAATGWSGVSTKIFPLSDLE